MPSDYMYELRCNSDAVCLAHWLVETEKPEMIENGCPYCGQKQWVMSKTSLTKQEYFARVLRDPEGTIGYHITENITTTAVRSHKRRLPPPYI